MTQGPGASDGVRPPTSVVVPFAGNELAARELLAALAELHRRPEDELIVVDNTRRGALLRVAAGQAVLALSANREQSSYYARNVGAARARNDWLLFIDADCRPRPTLLDDYFHDPVDPACAVLAGEIAPAPAKGSTVARYSAARGMLRQLGYIRHPHAPFGATANLLVRRSAWAAVDGFCEGIRSGGDADLCWRLQAFGWTLSYRPRAVVLHRHRETWRALGRQMLRYGGAQAWLNTRHPGAFPRPRLVRPLVRGTAVGLFWLATGRLELARFKVLDALVTVTQALGYLGDNRAPPGAAAASSPLRSSSR